MAKMYILTIIRSDVANVNRAALFSNAASCICFGNMLDAYAT